MIKLVKKNKPLIVDQQYIVKADWCVLYDSIIKIVRYSKEEKKYYFKSMETKLTHDKNTYVCEGSFREDEEFRFLLKPCNPKRKKFTRNIVVCFKLGYVILKSIIYASILTIAYYGSIYLTNFSKDINVADLKAYFNLILQIVILVMIITFCVKKVTKELTGKWLPIKYRIVKRRMIDDEIHL